jgi:outer membrane protein OmpA-like peptidoglycan-associated protein
MTMKKILLLTIPGLMMMVNFSNIRADDNKTEEHVGFSSGLIIGALAGGPVGAIIGAASGAWLGDQVNEADKVEPLNMQIAQNKLHLLSLQVSLAEQSKVIDQSNILLEKQQVTLKKVAAHKELMSGLQVDLMFRTNSRQLEMGALQKIAPLVLMLEQFPQLELQLTGHGDVLGTDKANQQVALERTITVKQSFVNAGIDGQRIHLINLGRSQAEATLEDVDGRALDRRVRIEFMQAQTKPAIALK